VVSMSHGCGGVDSCLPAATFDIRPTAGSRSAKTPPCRTPRGDRPKRSSSILISGVRTVTTDGDGGTIVDMPPQLYRDLQPAGVPAPSRRGLELNPASRSTVNAELRVGALEETVIVHRGLSDRRTQNVRKQMRHARAVDALPTSTKNINTLCNSLPGFTGVNDVASLLADPCVSR